MTTDPRTLAETYFRAWKDQDFDSLRSVLADNATFTGPLGEAGNAEECIAGLRGMSRMMTDIVVLTRVVEGPDVVTMFELHTDQARPVLTANWSHVENEKISTILVVFDPRNILAGS